MSRRGQFAFQFFGTSSFPPKGLVEIFTRGNLKRKQRVVTMLGIDLLGLRISISGSVMCQAIRQAQADEIYPANRLPVGRDFS